ncbi:alpha-2,3-sialyltransferase [Campylobacter sp. 2457A]|uniref:alpha-2,3-sialyltransferase n=1 Tax=Campylobacter sp. 2457A TaxID=2735784 RepID=UPI00301CDFD6|nr:alpha-2,3-sialyltransferase [Campylobacter sp. 2457A]
MIYGGGNAIICGNGPSLKEIDYKRLPKEYDVFRCNQFYFEDKYYLGKNIKYAFFNQGVFLEQYYTAKKLIENQEYFIENIICSTFKIHKFYDNFFQHFDTFFPECLLGYKILDSLKEFSSYIYFNEIYHDQRITSGIYMCAIAIALGYKNIYLTGIDFYKNKNINFNTGENIYAYNLDQKYNIQAILGDVKPSYFHGKEIDLKALKFLEKKYQVSFFSLNPDSILAKNFPLAPLVNHCDFKVLEKNKESIQDILIPKETPMIQIYYHKIFNSQTIQKRLQLKEYNQDNNLKNFYSLYDTAKQRIQNQLSYKLGQAMIENLKSILGYIRMPYVLSYIKHKHKQEQKVYEEKIKKDPSLKLPPLESYPDYEEALKEKQCLTYKLGQALIQADKEWYRGGYIKLWFEIRKLKKEFRNKKEKYANKNR